MIPALLALFACSGDPAPKEPPAPAWSGGSVRAVALPDQGLALLDVAWRRDTPMLSPGRVPAEATVSLRRLDAGGAVVWETVLVEGERARALDLAVRPDGGLVALVVAPGAPATAGLVPVSATGAVGRMVPIGDPVNVQPRVLHADEKGRLFVGGSTAVPLYGHLQSPGQPTLDGDAGFVGTLDASLRLEQVEMWEASGLQSVTALASDAAGLAWVGTSRPRRGAPGAAVLGRLGGGDPTPLADLAEAQGLALSPAGAFVAGWAKAGEGTRGLPGSTPLAPRVLALDPTGAPRWSTDGCCATWAHGLDLQLVGDTLLFGGRADAATLRLGGLEAPGGAGVQAFGARLDTATGAVQGLYGLGRVGDTPLDLPVSVLPDACVVAAAGTPPLCPGAAASGG